jgi:hypothetical protein
MMGEKVNVAIKLASRDCGDGYDADDLEVLAAFFTMAGKAVRCGAQGLVYCCEPESERANKVLAEIQVKTPLNGLCTEFPQKIGAVAMNGRRFIYRIDQKENPHFSCKTCSVTTCPSHWSAQAEARIAVESGSEALPMEREASLDHCA